MMQFAKVSPFFPLRKELLPPCGVTGGSRGRRRLYLQKYFWAEQRGLRRPQ